MIGRGKRPLGENTELRRTRCASPLANSISGHTYLRPHTGAVSARPVAADFHENYFIGETAPPSDRSTGLVFAIIIAIVAALWRDHPMILWGAIGLAVTLTILSLVAPAVLRPLNLFWFKLGLLMHRALNPIVMFALFTLVFIPAGMLMRLVRDPLRAKRASQSPSYWFDQTKEREMRGSMADQF